MKRRLPYLAALLLLGCSSPELPSSNTLLEPPWEALVKAGPGAEKDIDLETLNGPQKVADVAPQIEPTPNEIVPEPEPKKLAPKPGDVEIKAVAVLSVQGKGGDELTTAMRKVLKDAGWPVLSAARADALSVEGRVSVDPAKGGQQLVHLVWVVSTPKGKVLGDIKQNNPVPAGSLDGGWGENAGFATQAAADGIFKLIEKFR